MDLRTGIIQSAQALGMDPLDLATIMSYETGGTFNPTKAGPTTQYGQHRGLIQFGQPQARQYGVNWNDPVGSQLGPDGAVVKYFKNAGYQPGMGLLDAYSAVNAGHVGRYNASDAGNGGAPGTVRDKVENQMAGHREKAAALLGMSPGAPTGASNPTPQSGFTPSGQALPQEAAAFQDAKPAAPNPAGFLSGLGSLLVSSAQASEQPSVPSLNAPTHAPEISADPLGVEAQGKGLLDWEGSYPDVPPQDPYGNDLRQNMRATVGDAASAVANDKTTNNGWSINDMLKAMDKLGKVPGAVKYGGGEGNIPKIEDVLGSTVTGAALPPDRPMPTGLTAGWSGIPSLPGAGTSPQDIRGPVQGPPMTAMTPPPMQGPPMSARMGSMQGPPMSAMTPQSLPPDRPMPGGPLAGGPQSLPPDRPMPGGPMSQPNLAQPDPTLPDTTSAIPTKKPLTKKPFDTLGFLTALGGLAGALGTGGPEVKPVSLSAPVHNPGAFQGLPMPRGLL